jgi:hypothetical protein
MPAIALDSNSPPIAIFFLLDPIFVASRAYYARQ